MDDVFTAVHNYNMMNKANKTIQLTVVPGVYSPSWLTDGGILTSCDPLFDGTKSSLPDCGMVTFSSYPEQRNALSPPNDPLIVPMPLPWSTQYLYYWDRFLVGLAARYGKDQALVSVAMAGPTCATTEMILPTTNNNSHQSPGDDVDQVWQILIANSFKDNKTYAMYPAQVFVDYWKQAIDTYERVFLDSKLALILTPDADINMPEFASIKLPLAPPRLNKELEQDFVNFNNYDCNEFDPSHILPDKGDSRLLFCHSPNPYGHKRIYHQRDYRWRHEGWIAVIHRPDRRARREASNCRSVTVHNNACTVVSRTVSRRGRV